MALNPLGAGTAVPLIGVGNNAPAPRSHFADALKASHSAHGGASSAPQPQLHKAVVKAGQTHAVGVSATSQSQGLSASRMVEQLHRAQDRMEHVLRMAESGRSFSPAQLLSLQTHVYRASQELDLAGKVVEKATGGVKQVLQTQV